jgi:hypothetical protein
MEAEDEGMVPLFDRLKVGVRFVSASGAHIGSLEYQVHGDAGRLSLFQMVHVAAIEPKEFLIAQALGPIA